MLEIIFCNFNLDYLHCDIIHSRRHTQNDLHKPFTQANLYRLHHLSHNRTYNSGLRKEYAQANGEYLIEHVVNKMFWRASEHWLRSSFGRFVACIHVHFIKCNLHTIFRCFCSSSRCVLFAVRCNRMKFVIYAWYCLFFLFKFIVKNVVHLSKSRPLHKTYDIFWLATKKKKTIYIYVAAAIAASTIAVIHNNKWNFLFDSEKVMNTLGAV